MDASTASSAPMGQVTSSKAVDADSATEDIRFLAFAKQYMALLAGVAAVPLLSSAISVLPPPESTKGDGQRTVQLTLLSSFVCLVMFAACFMLRGLLRKLATNASKRWSLAPFFITLVLLASAIMATSYYIDLQRHSTDPLTEAKPALSILLYLSVYPLYIAALGIVLVTSFTQRAGMDIQAIVDANLSGDEATSLRAGIEDYAGYLALARQHASLRPIGDYLVDWWNAQLKCLRSGRVLVRSSSAEALQNILLRDFSDSFECASDRDIQLREEEPHLAEQLFRQIDRAGRAGTAVTRIFILRSIDLKCDGLVARLLRQHEEAEIAWAVAIYDELDDATKQKSLDFGLLDRDEVLTYLSNEQGVCSFTAVFSTPDNVGQIQARREQFERLISQCWLVNQRFKERVPADRLGNAEKRGTMAYKLKALKRALLNKSSELTGIDEQGPFLFLSRSADDIQEKLYYLAQSHDVIVERSRVDSSTAKESPSRDEQPGSSEQSSSAAPPKTSQKSGCNDAAEDVEPPRREDMARRKAEEIQRNGPTGIPEEIPASSETRHAASLAIEGMSNSEQAGSASSEALAPVSA